MYLYFVLFATACLFLWLYLKWRNVKSFWAKKGVPHYPPHPIMGSLTFLQRQNPTLWMRQLYKDFKSPYVGIWLFWRPGLVINSPELAKRVLVKDSDNFRNRFLSSGKNDPIGALNLFTVNDPIWTSVRRRLTSVFTSAKLRAHTGITQAKAKDVVHRIAEANAKNEILDLRNLCTDYTTDVIGESAFGVLSESARYGDSIMRKVTAQFMEFNLFRGLSWSSIFFCPEAVNWFGFSLFPAKTIELLRKIYRTIVQQRGGFDKPVKETKDLLDALLKIKQEAAIDNEEMTEDFILAQAAIFLVGGFDTSAATMSWVIYKLAWHPEIQQRVYDEVLEAKQRIGESEFDADNASELTYLNCIIKETLRFFPPMGWLDRVASKDYQIDENLTISAGTVVYVNASGMQVDPQYFPDPLVFDPDRFLPENEKNITPYTYMPFGEGPRMCIGMRFGYQTLRQGITSILLNYEIKPVPNTPIPLDVKIESKGMFFMPLDEKMVVQFVPRQKE